MQERLTLDYHRVGNLARYKFGENDTQNVLVISNVVCIT